MSLVASAGQLRASYIRWALFLVPALVLLGTLSGTLSGSGSDDPWFAALEKPAIYPPPALFGIAWTILYALMGFALALVVAATGAPGRLAAIAAFVVQFLVNLAWSPVFFGSHQITGGLAVILLLDVLVVITIVLFWRVRALAGILLLPYLAWILFASVLNWQFLELNPELDGKEVSGPVQRIEF